MAIERTIHRLYYKRAVKLPCVDDCVTLRASVAMLLYATKQAKYSSRFNLTVYMIMIMMIMERSESMPLYTAFNQTGRAVMTSSQLAELGIAMRDSGFKYYFIADSDNRMIVNELRGRRIPKRTSHGTITDSLCVHGCGFLTSECTCNDWRGVLGE